MTGPSSDADPAPSWEAWLLPGVALAWIVPAAAVTSVELVAGGRLNPVVAAVDVVAAFLVPFAVLWLLVTFLAPDDQPPREDDDNRGGGGPPEDPDPAPPSDDLDIDWERFEADVHAYARSREVLA